MRIITAITYLPLTTLLIACGQQNAAPDIDPVVGRACFDQHQMSLQQGTQYEGIEKVTPGKVLIRIMDGVKVATIECELNPDGTLK